MPVRGLVVSGGLRTISTIPMPALRSRDTWRAHGSLLNTQKPVSVPTLKHETSLLKDALSEMGPWDSSITGRVFMVGVVVGCS